MVWAVGVNVPSAVMSPTQYNTSTPSLVLSGVVVKSHLPLMFVTFDISQNVPCTEAEVPLKKVRPSLLHVPVWGLYSCRVVVPMPFFAEPTIMYFLPFAAKK